MSRIAVGLPHILDRIAKLVRKTLSLVKCAAMQSPSAKEAAPIHLIPSALASPQRDLAHHHDENGCHGNDVHERNIRELVLGQFGDDLVVRKDKPDAERDHSVRERLVAHERVVLLVHFFAALQHRLETCDLR